MQKHPDASLIHGQHQKLVNNNRHQKMTKLFGLKTCRNQKEKSWVYIFGILSMLLCNLIFAQN
jgi:hypothetical protein